MKFHLCTNLSACPHDAPGILGKNFTKIVIIFFFYLSLALKSMKVSMNLANFHTFLSNFIVSLQILLKFLLRQFFHLHFSLVIMKIYEFYINFHNYRVISMFFFFKFYPNCYHILFLFVISFKKYESFYEFS